MVFVLWFRLHQCLNAFTMLPVKGSFETGLFGQISIHVFWLFPLHYLQNDEIWQINQLWSSSFFCKCSKFDVDFENARNSWEKAFCFWDNCFRTGCVKLSLLRREYWSSAINVLTNTYKAFLLTKTDFFRLNCFTIITKYGNSAVVQITTVFERVYDVACQRVVWNGTFWTNI